MMVMEMLLSFLLFLSAALSFGDPVDSCSGTLAPIYRDDHRRSYCWPGIFLIGLNECREDFRTADGSMFQTPFFWEAITLPEPGRFLGLLGR
jgi:hypothetical protein